VEYDCLTRPIFDLFINVGRDRSFARFLSCPSGGNVGHRHPLFTAGERSEAPPRVSDVARLLDVAGAAPATDTARRRARTDRARHSRSCHGAAIAATLTTGYRRRQRTDVVEVGFMGRAARHERRLMLRAAARKVREQLEYR